MRPPDYSYPTWIITQLPGEVPRRRGPFYGAKHVEQMLRDLYKLHPDGICIVIGGIENNDWYPEHGYAWLDINGDRRRRHPRKEKENKRPA